MPRRSFLLFSGSNDRAVIALLRAFRACGSNCAVIARGHGDRILRSAYQDQVTATRSTDELSLPVFERLLDKVRVTIPDDQLVVVPSSEYLNTFLLGLDREDLRARLGCEIPLVGRDLYMALSNKSSATDLIGAAGIRVPARMSRFQVDALPLVAKPIRNVGSDGVVRYPLLLRTLADFDAFLARDDVEMYFAQEFIHGRSEYLLAYIARTGETFLASQVNLAQQPHGKSVVLAKTSEFRHDPVARQAVDMLRSLNFHGFAMIEFMVDASGPCFIEINPRPWGPLQLCRDHSCGIVEAFIGDALHGDPMLHERIWREKPSQARYLWFGGMAETWARRGALRWDAGVRSRAMQIIGSLPSDVYLGRDAWKVFLREMWNK